MFARWRRNRKELELAHTLYCVLVDQARSEAFYKDFGVEDTLEGRLDLILLHVFIIVETLRSDDLEVSGLLQKLQEVMIRDIDRSLREIGVGDMNVGKQMRHVGASLLGRLKVYHDSVAGEGDREKLETAIVRNIFRENDSPHVADLAEYICAALEDTLVAENRGTYDHGVFKFPMMPKSQ
jgi:cytochrome b pre-mRNA-processing protein 3